MDVCNFHFEVGIDACELRFEVGLNRCEVGLDACELRFKVGLNRCEVGLSDKVSVEELDLLIGERFGLVLGKVTEAEWNFARALELDIAQT